MQTHDCTMLDVASSSYLWQEQKTLKQKNWTDPSIPKKASTENTWPRPRVSGRPDVGVQRWEDHSLALGKWCWPESLRVPCHGLLV